MDLVEKRAAAPLKARQPAWILGRPTVGGCCSHVLEAMGLGARAGETIRVLLPWNTTDADIDAFIAAYRTIAVRLRRAA